MEKIEEILEELGYTLEHKEFPSHVGEWDDDESSAYRDNGGFLEGRKAVQAVRAHKLAQAVSRMLVEARAQALEGAAHTMNYTDNDALLRAAKVPECEDDVLMCIWWLEAEAKKLRDTLK